MWPRPCTRSWGDAPCDPATMVRSPALPSHRTMAVKRILDVAGSALGLTPAAASVGNRCGHRKARESRPGFLPSGTDRTGRPLIPDFQVSDPWCVDAARAGTALTVRADTRSYAGRRMFLRSNKIDELPQLINVLAGDMSIVGPATRGAGIHEILHAGSARDHPLNAAGNDRLRSHPVSRRKFATRSGTAIRSTSIGVRSCR